MIWTPKRSIPFPKAQRGFIGAQALGVGRRAAAATGDPYWANVVLLAINDSAANGTSAFTDQSNSAHAVTGVGNAQYSTAHAFSGETSSYLGDGTGDYLQLDDSADWYFPGSVTIEIGVRWSVLKNTAFVCQRVGGTNWQIFYTAGSVYLQKNNGGGVSFAWTPTVDTDYKLAFEWNGTYLSAYVDGVREAQNTANIFNVDIAAPLYICGLAPAITSAYDHNGFAASVRITKGVARMDGAASYTPDAYPYPTS